MWEDAWRLGCRHERTIGNDATTRATSVVRLRSLGVQAVGTVSRIAFDRRTESDDAISAMLRLDQLLKYDAAAATSGLEHQISTSSIRVILAAAAKVTDR